MTFQLPSVGPRKVEGLQEIPAVFQILKQQGEDDVLSQLIGNAYQDGERSATDILSEILADRRLGPEAKNRAVEMIGNIGETRQKFQKGELELNELRQAQQLSEQIYRELGYLPPTPRTFEEAKEARELNPVAREVLSRKQNLANPQKTLDDLNDTQLGIVEGSKHKGLAAAAKRKSEQRKEDRELRNKIKFEANKRVQDYLKQADQDAEHLRTSRFAVNRLNSAILSGSKADRSLNRVADYFGLEILKTARGAEFDNAAKQLLFSELGRIKGRPNEFLERLLSNSIGNLQRSKEANATTARLMEANIELGEARQQIINDLVSQYPDGDFPANFAQIVDAQMESVARDIEQKTAYDIQRIQDAETGDQFWFPKSTLRQQVLDKQVKGSVLTHERLKILAQEFGDMGTAIDRAKELGYYIPTDEQLTRWGIV